jgi:iron complex transport system ATP-binding protein
MMTRDSAIAISGLSFRYDRSGSAVLDHLDLRIPPESICAILGPNGSGKTTLLHLLLGLLMPNSGRITYADGAGPCQKQYDLKRLIGFVPQKETIPFDLSLLEYVVLGRAPHLGLFQLPGEEDRRIALSSLKTVGLDHLAARKVPSLSGGENQLAMVARALTQETRILLLDEPTAHLDIANTKKIQNLMQRLVREGKTVVFTTNEPNTASACADYAVLLKKGRLEAAGPIGEVITADHLSTVYGIDVQVIPIKNRPFVVTF